MNNLKYIVVHHSGGTSDPYASTQNFTADQINESHRFRWPEFKSSMGKYTGYNIVILKDGSWVQTRALGEETAHTRGFNTTAIGILVMGNFTLKNGVPVDRPTKDQDGTLKTLTMKLLMRDFTGLVVVPGTTFSLRVNNIYPHRYFNSTSCYGNYLADNWARDLINEVVQIKIAWIRSMISFLQTQLDEMRRKKIGRLALQGDDYDCPGHL